MSYEANGNVTQITDNLNSARNQNFSYDQLNRIKQADEGPVGNSGVGRWGQSYTIDAWGNLSNIALTKGTASTLSVAIGTNNRFTTSGYTYDAAGDLTADGVHTYVYDAESRIMSIDSAATTYTYDANGMRIRKTTGSNFTEYIYFGSDVIAEKDQAGNWTDYIFAGGKRIAKAPGVVATTGTEFYHADHLGSARLMTNYSGTVVSGSEGTFLPYGEEYALTTSGNHYKFTGKERDSESNLDYFGARYYGSTRGRFLTPDWSEAPTPVPYADFNDPQTLNLYSYVKNKPLFVRDPTGHMGDDERNLFQEWGDVVEVKVSIGPSIGASFQAGPVEYKAEASADVEGKAGLGGGGADIKANFGTKLGGDVGPVNAEAHVGGSVSLKEGPNGGVGGSVSAPGIKVEGKLDKDGPSTTVTLGATAKVDTKLGAGVKAGYGGVGVKVNASQAVRAWAKTVESVHALGQALLYQFGVNLE